LTGDTPVPPPKGRSPFGIRMKLPVLRGSANDLSLCEIPLNAHLPAESPKALDPRWNCR
jgi:hypothetical protein